MSKLRWISFVSAVVLLVLLFLAVVTYLRGSYTGKVESAAGQAEGRRRPQVSTGVPPGVGARRPLETDQEEPKQEKLQVLVLEAEQRRPIRGARVVIESKAGMSEVGKTNDDGSLPINLRRYELPESDRLNLWVSASGFSTERERLPSATTGVWPVLLDVEAVLRGLVTGPEGPMAGLNVLAVDARTVPSASSVQAALAGLATESTTITDRNGRYALFGLSPNRRYALHAGGRGYLSDARREYSRPGAAEVDIPVDQCYCVHVVLVDLAGGEPVLGSSLFGSWYGAYNLAGSGFELLALPEWMISLAGASRELLASVGAFSRLQLFSSTSPHPRATVGFQCSLPGYRPVQAEVPVSQLADVQNAVLTLEPESTGFGELRLQFSPPLGFAGNRKLEVGVLTMREVSQDLQLDARVIADVDGARIDGIPWGAYVARFHPTRSVGDESDATAAPFTFDVGPTPNILEIPIPRLGAAEIIVLRGDRRYRGKLRVRCTASDVGDVRLWTFPADPYVIPMLPEGDYTIQVYSPFRSDDDRPPFPLVRVTAGGSAVVIVDPPESFAF